MLESSIIIMMIKKIIFRSVSVPSVHWRISECDRWVWLRYFLGSASVCHQRETKPFSPLYLPVAWYCDLGVAIDVRLQAHLFYSAETLPLTKSAWRARVIKTLLFSTHTCIYICGERESTRTIGDRNTSERLERDTLPARAFYTRTPRFPGTSRRRNR